MFQGDANNVTAGESSKPQDEISDLSEKNEKNKDKLQSETFEVTEKETTEKFDKENKKLESLQEPKDIHSDKELLISDSIDQMRQKKHSKQESIFLTQENKDLISNEDDLDFDEDFEAFKKERR